MSDADHVPDDPQQSSEPKAGRKAWLVPAVVVVLWLMVASFTGPFAGKLADVATNNQADFLPNSAEATKVADLQESFRTKNIDPALIVYQRDSGITKADRSAATRAAHSAGSLDGVVGQVVGPIGSQDGKALEVIVLLDASLGDQLPTLVKNLRHEVGVDLPAGLDVYVTGPAGFLADLLDAFAGIDGILLLVAVAVVLLILVAVYRSPILPFLVLFSAIFGLSLASGVVYWLANSDTLTLNGESQGILFILVVGATTDYALLLTSRFREELREDESRFVAMRIALRQSLTPILASGITVILALLCLLFSDLNSTRSLGPVAAIGILAALLSGLTFLPSTLVLFGRVAFWPRHPEFGSEHPERSGVWGKVAAVMSRRPRPLWIGATGLLIVLAAFTPTLQAGGVTNSAILTQKPQSVTGEAVAARHFPAGTGSPVVIIGPAKSAKEISDTAEGVKGIVSAAPLGPGGQPVAPGSSPNVVDGRVEVEAVLQAPPDSDSAIATVKHVRSAVHSVVPGSLIGGATAIQLDTRNTAERDLRVIIPIILFVILILLMVVLRAILAPILLLASVVLSFTATLGASALVFNHVFHFPGAAASVPLYGFVFLVALGIDYNIFLMTRIREESSRLGTRPGIVRGLVVTGGVITSAGIVLAATFSALSVIPILFLAQIAFIVAFGVLLDTFLVRSLLVPALAYDIGPPIWWPMKLDPTQPSTEPDD